MKIDLEFNCPKRWNEMEGGDRVRHCSLCDKNVHRVEQLTPTEVSSLIDSGQSCVSMVVNGKGEVKTASGFSKGLLLVGLAFGCGGETISSDNGKTSVHSTSASDIEKHELTGEAKSAHVTTNSSEPEADCDSTKQTDKSSYVRPYTGRVSHSNKSNTTQNTDTLDPVKKEEPVEQEKKLPQKKDQPRTN